MCSMMLGSMLYNNMTTGANPLPAKPILAGTLFIASLCFFVPGHFRDERATLWCFCIFELCCGIYYPVMASLRGNLIADGSRASIYGILRVPLNVFVVLALSTTKEGTSHVPSKNNQMANIFQARRIATQSSPLAAYY